MKQDFLLVPLGHSDQAIPVRLGLVGHGPACFIQLAATDRNLKFLLKAEPRHVLDVLDPILDDIRATLGDIPPGIVRAETNGSGEHGDAFSFSRRLDVRQALEKIHGPLDEQAANGNGAAVVDQAALDWAIVQPHALELLDETGALVWGGQSRIAELLNVTNAGQSNRGRILAVVERLETGFGESNEERRAA